jgi:lipopolysaccharide/colanic/teichoic acid biosynthesis glycosyltransferase
MEGVANLRKFFDFAIAIAFVVFFLAPLLIAITVKLVVDGSPVFYISCRQGLNNKEFNVFKLRTMITDRLRIERVVGELTALGGFQRIPLNSKIYTPLGRLFEVTQIVELPQLLNVIFGQMSLVGNRPLPKQMNVDMEKRFGKELVSMRMLAKPGITGIVQIIGKVNLSDSERLSLEAKFAKFLTSASPMIVGLVYLTILVETGVQIISRGRFAPLTFRILAWVNENAN